MKKKEFQQKYSTEVERGFIKLLAEKRRREKFDSILKVWIIALLGVLVGHFLWR